MFGAIREAFKGISVVFVIVFRDWYSDSFRVFERSVLRASKKAKQPLVN